MADRFQRMGDSIGAGLRCLRQAGAPDHQPAGELAGWMATILRARLGPCERLTLASAGPLALDRDARQELLRAAERDRKIEECPLSLNPKMYAAEMREFFRRHPVSRHA